MFLGLPNHKTRPCVVVHSYRSYFSGLAEPVLLSFSSFLEKAIVESKRLTLYR
jgi:hypothetical protein